MQGMNPGQGSNQGGKQQSGLSWSTPSSSSQNQQTSSLLGSSAKPASSSAPAVKNSTNSASPTRPRVAMENNTLRTAGSFVAGVLVGAILMASWGAMNPVSTTPTTNNSATSINGSGLVTGGTTTNTSGTGSAVTGTTGSAITTSNDIEIADQAAGMEVVVADATVSLPTWLVVYELFEGKPVRALGATMFFPEYNGKGGIISLLRATEPNTTYFVGQSLDTGEHTFTPHVNQEVLDSNGSMIGTTFKTH